MKLLVFMIIHIFQSIIKDVCTRTFRIYQHERWWWTFFYSFLDIWKTAKKYQKQYQISPTTKKLFKFWIFLFLSTLFRFIFLFGCFVCVTVWKQLPSVYLFSTLKGIKRTKIKFIKTKKRSFYFGCFRPLDKQWNNNNKFILQSTRRELEKITSCLYTLCRASYIYLLYSSVFLHSFLCCVQENTYKMKQFFLYSLFYSFNKLSNSVQLNLVEKLVKGKWKLF